MIHDNIALMKMVAVIIETDFRDEEAIYPIIRLREAGCQVDIVTDQKKKVFGKFGFPFEGDTSFEELDVEKYDAVIIPGGNEGPDRLRTNLAVLEFIRAMYEQEKLVAAICHGVWLLVSAKIIRGKQATCYPAIRDDVVNAGAIYKDEAVVVDGNMITSRHPRDLPDFMRKVVAALAD